MRECVMARKLLNVAVLVSALAISAEAQTLRRDQGPVNFPPPASKALNLLTMRAVFISVLALKER